MRSYLLSSSGQRLSVNTIKRFQKQQGRYPEGRNNNVVPNTEYQPL